MIYDRWNYEYRDFRQKDFEMDEIEFIYRYPRFDENKPHVKISGKNYNCLLIYDSYENAIRVRIKVIAQIASNSKERINKFIKESIGCDHMLNLTALSKSENISKKKKEYIEAVLIMNKLTEK